MAARQHVGPLQAKPDLAHGGAMQAQGRGDRLMGFCRRALQDGPDGGLLLAEQQPAFAASSDLAVVALGPGLVGVTAW